MGERVRDLEPSARLLEALEDIGVLGEWSFDYATQILRSSPGISSSFAIDVDAGERGQPVEVYERAIHPDDVKWLRSTRSVAPGWSGLKVTEIRVKGIDGRERWIMVRGRFVLGDDDQPVLGYGVMLDMTHYHESGDRPMVTPAAPMAEPWIELLDSLSNACRAARQIGVDVVEQRCRALLTQSARRFAREKPGMLPLKATGRHGRRLH